jgi:diguanylate cyclase (GGDEF)-like protein
MFGFSIDRLKDSISLRDLLHVAIALLWCACVVLLDIATDADIVEAFLTPIALLIVYPVKRNWATGLIALVCLVVVIAGAAMEPPGESVTAMLYNRTITTIVLLGITFLIWRVTASEQQLVRIATTDALTGIFNRRHFMSLAAREQQRAERYQTTFSLLILDIDHFKRINDTFGHPVGDEAIKAMAVAASKHLRPTDVIGRFGGEEFVVLLPHTDEPGAVIAAERIREAVAQVMVQAGDKIVTFTVSVGLATHVRRTGVEQLIEVADQALYAAKQGGRNQVRIGRIAEGGASTHALAPA